MPGGRILKGESLDQAFERLIQHELDEAFYRDSSWLLGVYQHYYSDSVFGSAGNPSSHYVVLGYQLALGAGEAVTPRWSNMVDTVGGRRMICVTMPTSMTIRAPIWAH
ncbi:hypothetical protein [Halomonas stenophila]|uniref:Uncharacterized protein n=1 Tax=Halomonas stenophila TaxID=795312 RepID=A0A7W5EQV0_9GAMM|nr:hypothetical protein [Halomonas stenophila]MBB3229759.1 hypothetical protein [Halomonas stenophila]